MSLPNFEGKDGNGINRSLPAHLSAADTLTLTYSTDGAAPTYHYAKSGLTPVATPAEVLVIQGSATKTVRIRKIAISGVATAAGNMVATIERWSSAPTLGSAVLTAIAAAKGDSENDAATAVVSTVGTANITTQGTTAGVVRAGRVCLSADGSGLDVKPLEWDFGVGGEQALVLRGDAEYAVIDLGGDIVPAGGALDFSITLVEEDES